MRDENIFAVRVPEVGSRNNLNKHRTTGAQFRSREKVGKNIATQVSHTASGLTGHIQDIHRSQPPAEPEVRSRTTVFLLDSKTCVKKGRTLEIKVGGKKKVTESGSEKVQHFHVTGWKQKSGVAASGARPSQRGAGLRGRAPRRNFWCFRRIITYPFLGIFDVSICF